MPAWKALRSASAIALAATLLAAGSPALSAAESPTNARTSVRCTGERGDRAITHRFRLPRSGWEILATTRYCKSKRHKVTAKVAWRKGAGTRDGIARQLELAAASKPGFHYDKQIRPTKPFKSPKRKTWMAQYSFRKNGARHRVRLIGDRLTLLRVSAPKGQWGMAKKTAVKARSTMVRRWS